MHKDVKAIYEESKILDEATHLYGVRAEVTSTLSQMQKTMCMNLKKTESLSF